MAQRVVITGMGAVTPIGIGLREYWEGLLEGRNGVAPISLFDPSDYPTRIAAEVKDWDPTRFIDRKRARLMARGTQFGVAAALMALEDAHWAEHPGDGRLGVVGGISNSAQDAVEDAIDALKERGLRRVSPFVLNKSFPHSLASEAGLSVGWQDDVSTVSTACTAGINATARAFDHVRAGTLTSVLAVASDATISRYVFAGFVQAGLLSKNNELPEQASRPFDAKRDGGVLGEGAGAVVVESLEHARRRGARIYAEILGCGAAGVGFGPEPKRRIPLGMAAAMRKALAAANCGPEHIDYVGCHGVSDPHLDVWETRAMKDVLGERAYRIPMSSVKSMIGIPQCAAGMLQAVATILAMTEGVLPPTINYEFPDPECDLDYVPNTPRRNRVERALVFAHGFNGSDAAVVLARGPEC